MRLPCEWKGVSMFILCHGRRNIPVDGLMSRENVRKFHKVANCCLGISPMKELQVSPSWFQDFGRGHWQTQQQQLTFCSCSRRWRRGLFWFHHTQYEQDWIVVELPPFLHGKILCTSTIGDIKIKPFIVFWTSKFMVTQVRLRCTRASKVIPGLHYI